MTPHVALGFVGNGPHKAVGNGSFIQQHCNWLNIIHCHIWVICLTVAVWIMIVKFTAKSKIIMLFKIGETAVVWWIKSYLWKKYTSGKKTKKINNVLGRPICLCYHIPKIPKKIEQRNFILPHLLLYDLMSYKSLRLIQRIFFAFCPKPKVSIKRKHKLLK